MQYVTWPFSVESIGMVLEAMAIVALLVLRVVETHLRVQLKQNSSYYYIITIIETQYLIVFNVHWQKNQLHYNLYKNLRRNLDSKNVTA